MTLSRAVFPGCGVARRTAGVVLALLLTMPTAALAAAESPAPVSTPGAAAATDHDSHVPSAEVVPSSAPPAVFAGIIGDRQRMVQVALIFMGVAILILTRGNRF